MKAFGKAALASILFGLSIGSAFAQATDGTAKAVEAAASAASSAASAASSAASAASSADAAKAAAAKFDLPVGIVVGNRIKLRSNVYGLTPVGGASGKNARAQTCLRVTRLNDNGGITVAVEEGGSWLNGTCEDPSPKEGPITDPVKVNDTYKISGDQLKNASYARYGWIYGPMFVPFKYFPHDRSFEPSQSLGMYMGYRTSWFESQGLSWVASAGLSTMKVSEVVDDTANPGSKTTKESTVAGYTIAIGALFDLTNEAKPFVAGLLLGRDFVGRNSALTYKHDNRNWVAFQIGWQL